KREIPGATGNCVAQALIENAFLRPNLNPQSALVGVTLPVIAFPWDSPGPARRPARRAVGGCAGCPVFEAAAPHGRLWLRSVKCSRERRRGPSEASRFSLLALSRQCEQRPDLFPDRLRNPASDADPR